MNTAKLDFKKFKPYVWTKHKKENGVIVSKTMHFVVYIPEYKGGVINVESYGIKRAPKHWTRTDENGNSFQVNGYEYTLELSSTMLPEQEYIKVKATPSAPFFIFEKIVIQPNEFDEFPLIEIRVKGDNLPGGQGHSTVNLKDSDEP